MTEEIDEEFKNVVSGSIDQFDSGINDAAKYDRNNRNPSRSDDPSSKLINNRKIITDKVISDKEVLENQKKELVVKSNPNDSDIDEINRSNAEDINSNVGEVNNDSKSNIVLVDDAWSEDGLVHCVETSDELITCHTYDKPHNHYNAPADAGLSWYTGSGKHVNDKSSSISDKYPDINDALEVANSNEASPYSQPVRLELRNGIVNIVDSTTGERRDLNELRGIEDVDIDSLILTPSKKKKTLPATDVETLGNLINEMTTLNHEEIRFDTENLKSQKIWLHDLECNR